MRNTKQMKLGAFFFLPGHHLASWRYPSAKTNEAFTFDFIKEQAQLAEKAKFDMVFFADVFGEEIVENDRSGLKFDPIVLISALQAVTKNIGFVSTATTTYNEPFHLARKFGSIDHLSGGRAAWNIVTSSNGKEASLFGKDHHLEHARRYERAEEFVEVTKKLWHSVEKEALVLDKESGQFLNKAKTHCVEHHGEWFDVEGYLDQTETPQGHPVLVQAGSSEAGKEFAAKTAEVIFTAWQTLEAGQQFYADVKGRLRKYGRHADDLKVMPGVFITVAKTEEEARAKQQQLSSYILPEVGLKYLSGVTDSDFSQYDIDDAFPLDAPNADPSNPQTRYHVIRDLAVRENLVTIREVYERVAGARGHREIVGTPTQIVDQLEEWFVNGAADGFNIMPPHFPEGFTDIINLVIPELQRRGLFRTEYESTTLRGNLGLKTPTASDVLGAVTQ
ncbi:nitrilotriacetate monooxygenase [Kurthia sp. 3B1D]|uniref:Nitrilotriacetate monooxygenase n=1 Tax=Candidatus Kurthia intestinigallinarum TaxID=1562256 RepID=A0A433RTI6_9BACL|nr:LLM class flavin-dependent oxidoreductase [Kurthia sp. 3B1D]RUS55471.1 nitrilotriacetate monooxygenase [Kurthia sp. 3B1D]